MSGFVSALALCGKAFKNIGSICSTMRLEAVCEAIRIKYLHHFNTPLTTQVQSMTMLWTHNNQQILSILERQDTGPTRKYFLRTWMHSRNALHENGRCRRLNSIPDADGIHLLICNTTTRPFTAPHLGNHSPELQLIITRM